MRILPRGTRAGCSPRAVARLLALGLVLGGCGEVKRIAGIEKSTKKTEKTTGELNENTKDVKESIEGVDVTTQAMRRELDRTRRELQDANRRLDGANRNLEETNRNLTETRTAIKDLEAVMATMRDNTNDLVANTGDTYVDLRQGETLAARARSLARLESTAAMEAKIAEAWKYFAAFEFQFWKGRGADTPERRGELFRDALDEFLRDLERYLPAQSLRDGSPLSEEEGRRNIYALATAVEAYNILQGALVTLDADFRRVSLLDLLHGGLEAGNAARAGVRPTSSLVPWETLVMEKEDVVRHFLSVRMNFLPAIPLARLTEVERGGAARLLDLAKLGLTRWEARLDILNNVQIASMNSWFDKSFVESEFLAKHWDGHGYDKSLSLAYRNMRVVDGAVAGASAYLEERRELVAAFVDKAAIFSSRDR
jgi:hypothetical protein